MTQAQANDLERAMNRALEQRIELAGQGTRKSDGATVYAVTSGTEAGLFHLVAVEDGRLICSCKAGQRGRICKHRAVVHDHLKTQAEATRQAQARDRETAPIHYRNRAISPFR